MRKNKVTRTKRTKALFSICLSMAIMAQTVLVPALLLAADATPPPLGTSTSLTAVSNPSLEIINQKIEAIAQEDGIPSVLLKAIAYKESSWRQFDSQGNPILGGPSTHPAIGLMQVASYSDTDQATIAKLKSDIDFNIRMGADILNQKWAMVPKIGDGDRNKLENWYFALWAYNCWSGKNNPNQPPTPVPTPTLATTTTSLVPTPVSVPLTVPIGSTSPSVYQDKVLDIIAHPPSLLSKYIQPVAISLIPAASLPQVGVPTVSTSWQTPSPFHLANLGTVIQAIKFSALKRIAGTDRVDTAIQQALAGWPQGASSVVLARSDDFPDALAGVPLAAQLDAPVLLTPPEGLDSRLQAALQVLHPGKIYLLGGEGALSAKVSTDLQTLGWDSGKQTRLSGANRYATAANIAQAITGVHSAVAIATGENFPDALSIASIAGQKKMPVLLTTKTQLPQETLAALQQMKPSQIYLIGGEGVISPSVAQAIASAMNMSPSSVLRLAGATRYETMAAVGKAFDGDIKGLSFATGEDFPNALTGAALAVHQNQTLVLLPNTSLTDYPELKSFISHHLTQSMTQPYLFGSVQAIPQGIEDALNSML